jgi:hypothetical protein
MRLTMRCTLLLPDKHLSIVKCLYNQQFFFLQLTFYLFSCKARELLQVCLQRGVPHTLECLQMPEQLDCRDTCNDTKQTATWVTNE